MATAQSALQQDQHLLSQIDAAYTQNQDAQTRAESLSALASVMNGNNERKLSLERFVLRAYLQEVLTVANTRLGNLTAAGISSSCTRSLAATATIQV